MNYILENKIQILIISECIAWLLLIPMFYFRHWHRIKIAFIVSMALSGFFGYIPHITIPLIVCYHEKSLSALYQSKDTLFFIIIILILFVFGMTKGKSVVLKIDNVMYNLAQNYRQR